MFPIWIKFWRKALYQIEQLIYSEQAGVYGQDSRFQRGRFDVENISCSDRTILKNVDEIF